MLGVEPKLEDPEIIAAKEICEEMRDIAKKLPKPIDTKNETKKIMQFGNNFYFLFLSIQREKTKPDRVPPGYLDRARKYGEKWQEFLRNKTGLVEKILKILEEQELFIELMNRSLKFYKNPKTYGIGDRIKEEINLNGIRYEIWSKLNPLLKEASEAMDSYGIKSEDFFS